MKIAIETMVRVPVETAWNAYCDPEAIVHWNFATPLWCCSKAENDLREGGRFSYRMEARDGSMGFDFFGSYTEVKAFKRIRYVLGDGREVTTEFAEKDGGTHVSTVFDAETVHEAEMQKSGWQAILDNYKQYAETL